MLSDEEKRTIENLKTEYEKLIKEDNILFPLYKSDAKRLINLIEKQSKEIEELKEYKHDAELTKIACCTAQNCEALNNCIKLERELQNADKKWKDKIKARIKELEEYLYRGNIKDDFLMIRIKAKIQELQSLLEKE